jgi:hypothetical protein
MRRITLAILVLCAALLYFAPGSRALMSGVAYTDFANIFTSNQRINAGLGVNVAPGATGTISSSGAIFERGRSVAMGAKTALTSSDLTFSASAGTWTVDSGDVIGVSWAQVGDTVIVAYDIQHTSTNASIGSQLRIALPASVPVAAAQTIAINTSVATAGRETGLQFVAAGERIIRIQRIPTANFTVETNNLDVQGTIVYYQ